LLVEGDQLGGEANTCIWGMFENTGDSAYYFGTSFFKTQYVVFDMTTFDEFNESYIQVGFAPIKENVDIAKLRYDYSMTNYAPDNKEKDSSYAMQGTADAYDQKSTSETVVEVAKPDATETKEQPTDTVSKAN